MMEKINKKKILIVRVEACSFAGPCQKVFEKMGYETATFDYRTGPYFSSRIVRRATRIFPIIKKWTKKDINRRFIRAVNKYRPNYVFALKGEMLEPETIELVKKKGIVTINWFPDFIWAWDGIEKLAPVYDLFFCQDPYVLRLLRDKGLKNCFYLPSAADIDKNDIEPFENREEEFNISMCGSYSKDYYEKRDKCLTFVKDLGLNIWGIGGWDKTELKDSFRGVLLPSEVINIYRKSKIVVNAHYTEEPAEGISPRSFEATAGGALLISDNGRADIFNLFKDGEEFVSFPDGDTGKLKELVEYYLSHPEERVKIARRGYEKTKTKHTYFDRMEEVFRVVMNFEKQSENLQKS
ncbi:MAG: hypothetical protein COV30_01250 [Candidatus Yanofskybacteria bacterium CG10_big_fil_rev_8_21_14_0_10_37_15]|uniref:Spore protein YkvP/CgeB glycosyl transferase-like domain-containing protein n=1 Tax=Candidatus Yanofskybacteria bacterium CG10_big_fil_rev_8_21_14_0_10_37_15 TaxID=1975097 RepID=A0A2H0R5M7_9BACT|nr:MAG: hypothetical protein COV30_01250 [Candidatus Yanofskybacteria bacterium CG10_big_fil_rev_8_21_14_0_10_37_15]